MAPCSLQKGHDTKPVASQSTNPQELTDPTLNAQLHAINDNGGRDRDDLVRGWFGGRPRLGTQLVIFDLDSTLTNSADGIVASFLHALSHVGTPGPEGDLAAQIVGPPMDDTFRAMELGENVDAAIAAFRAEYGTRGWAMNTLLDGIAPAAGRSARRRHPAGRGHLQAGTDGAAHPGPLRARRAFRSHRRRQPRRLAQTKIEVLAHALDQLQPLPERVLMVGDHSHDVDGAAHHGIDTVVVGWGYGKADFPDGSTATSVTHAATVDELRGALGV